MPPDSLAEAASRLRRCNLLVGVAKSSFKRELYSEITARQQLEYSWSLAARNLSWCEARQISGMKLIEFSIAKDCIALERGADYFDLHNNFDFHGFVYDAAQRTLELRWIRGNGAWIKATEPAELRLSFTSVFLFKARERDAEMPFTEDDCLASIGFIWDDMLSKVDGYTSNQPKDGCTHIIIMFMSGFCIKVGAGSVSLSVTGGAFKGTSKPN